MGPSYRWDPAQYVRFSAERGRAFEDLVARIGIASPRRVVDIGCGPGSMTWSFADRWPLADVTGVDSSPEMIAAAADIAVSERVRFVCADLRDWQPDPVVDLVVGNAVLQWVPGHVDLLADLARWLAPGGTLAFQVPDSFDEPCHTIVDDLQRSVRWRDRLRDGVARTLAVERPDVYLDALVRAGLDADVWQTTYLHVLAGEDAALEWMKGTALRPALDLLADDPDATQDFLAECGALLRAAYPSRKYGTLFPFRRTFAVGHAKASS
jgi:trans-aconitate 2-methyltransferase